jgi:hypothetical protein
MLRGLIDSIVLIPDEGPVGRLGALPLTPRNASKLIAPIVPSPNTM